MITCIAIDDEPLALEVIERYCDANAHVCLKKAFLDPMAAWEYLHLEPIELVFLDINMPGISGMQFAQKIAGKSMIIFTTAYSHYAAESYLINAVDYLVKPITSERFHKAVKKAAAFLSLNNNNSKESSPLVLLKSGSQTHPVKLSEILYLEKEGNYLTVHMKSRKILIRQTMSEIFTILPASQFIRIHKSYVASIAHIEVMETDQVIINGQKLPLGSTYRDALRAKFSGK